MRYKERKAALFTLLSLWVILVASCENILDLEPQGRRDTTTSLETGEDALQFINAAYERLLFNNSNNNFFWVFGTVASDNAVAGGDGSRAGIVEIDFFSHTPRTQEFNDFWIVAYSGIVQCNTVIEGVPNVNMDPDIRDRIIGEALFLRAYFYFELTQVFGDVPLFTALKPPSELKTPKSPKSEIYIQIISDCVEAAELLPIQYSGNNIGRATKGAALALAAKTNLYMKNWEQVLQYVSQIQNLGIYDLMEDYQDNFIKETQNNKESVWEIQHSNQELGVGNFLNQWWASKKFGAGYGFAEVTEDFVNSFESGDPRLKFTVAMNNDDYFGLIYKRSFSSTGFGVKKYLQPDEEVTQKADGDINYTAIRYAEVLLWEAESLAELGRVQEAQIPLELVRSRARNQSENPENTLPLISTNDQEEMLEMIRNERRVELGFEMHRFFDLVRWGLAGQVLENFQSGKHDVFALPQTELDLNPQLLQNPGY
jgi:hypothetical protein